MKERKPKILLIDDESSFRKEMIDMFEGLYQIIGAPNSRTAKIAVQNNQFDLIFLDLYLDTEVKLDGFDLIKPLRKLAPQTPIIVITKDQASQTLKKALQLGADDFVRKDELDAADVRQMIQDNLGKRKVIEKKKRETKPKQTNKQNKVQFIGENKKIAQIKKYLVGLSSKPDITILLTGENGVGKEVAAQYLHQMGARADKPFEAINLAAMTKSIMESELFGHKAGAFTDAKSDQIGAFQRANGGILFLDEIGEIDLDIQVKLLRFLEDKVIAPIGGKKIQLDVQIVAATNADLEKAVAEKRFRTDLYYRLKQFPIKIPALRKRPEDIPLLIDFFLSKEEETKDVFTSVAYQKLLTYPYPGNIRELSNIISTVCVKMDLLDVEEIDESLLPIELNEPFEEIEAIFSPQKINSFNSEEMDVKEKTAHLELEELENALEKHNGKKGDAAKELNLSMDNIRYRVEKYAKSHLEILLQFPWICKKYKAVVNEYKK